MSSTKRKTTSSKKVRGTKPVYKSVYVAPLEKIKHPLYAISFFSGVRGLDIGARKAGFQTLLHCDWWEIAGKAFELNINRVADDPHPYLRSEGIFLSGEEEGDIKKTDFAKIAAHIHNNLQMQVKKGEIDVLHGGPPCQGFSKCNNRKDTDDPRNYLIFELLRIAREMKPKVLVVEQVPDLLSGKFRHIWNRVRIVLNLMTDYRWGYLIMNAKMYGSRQSRERLIIIAVRRDLGVPLTFPKGKKPDLSKVSVNNLLPHIFHFSPGQYQDKIKSAKKNVFCTMTATGSEFVFEFDGKRRKPTIKERQVLTELEGLNLEGIAEGNQKTLLGNMVQISFAEALFRHIRTHMLKR